MIIDCSTCAMRDLACADCVVSHFLQMSPGESVREVAAQEARALRVLHGSGLVPPLRMEAAPTGT